MFTQSAHIGRGNLSLPCNIRELQTGQRDTSSAIVDSPWFWRRQARVHVRKRHPHDQLNSDSDEQQDECPNRLSVSDRMMRQDTLEEEKGHER